MAAYLLTSFPIRSLRSGGALQAPLCPLPKPVLRKHTKEITQEKKPNGCKRQRREIKESAAHPLLLVCGCPEGGRG